MYVIFACTYEISFQVNKINYIFIYIYNYFYKSGGVKKKTDNVIVNKKYISSRYLGKNQ